MRNKLQNMMPPSLLHPARINAPVEGKIDDIYNYYGNLEPMRFRHYYEFLSKANCARITYVLRSLQGERSSQEIQLSLHFSVNDIPLVTSSNFSGAINDLIESEKMKLYHIIITSLYITNV